MIYSLAPNRVFRTYLGGSNIERFCFGKETEDTDFPEDWLASSVRAFNVGREHITEGIGMTTDGTDILTVTGGEAITILAKLLDSAERLVIQVHPTVEFAMEHFDSPYGKTESWYFLDCTDEACVYIGFRPGATEKMWKDAFYAQDSEAMLDMLHRIPVKKGDCIFVPGGMPHAIGKGCFMLEIQEPSDLMGITERVTPSGREIPDFKIHMGLGCEKMLDMFDYTAFEYEELKQRVCLRAIPTGDGVRQMPYDALTDKFKLALLRNGADFSFDAVYAVAVVTSGEGTLCGTQCKKGDRLLCVREPRLIVEGDAEFEIAVAYSLNDQR